MKEIIVTGNQDGMSLHKLLGKVLPNAGGSFLYKMLRKKNITLNDKKADGKETIHSGDSVKIYFAEDTLIKFMGTEDKTERIKGATGQIDVLYEDGDILAINKPTGILSQKSKDSDISINEEMIQYLLNHHSITEDELQVFRPSVCNRLDRNTSGIILCGKTIKGLQELSYVLKMRTIHKYYRCFVKGEMKEPSLLEGYLLKDEKKNKVTILKTQPKNLDAKEIKTKYVPLKVHECIDESGKKVKYTYLEVLLITGRSHQIRAHLASIGHPLIGDEKYGDPLLNRFFRNQFKIKNQMLHCYRIEGSDLFEEIIAPIPEEFERVLSVRSDSKE